MLGMKVARTNDPSMGIRNRSPAPRWQRWSEGEAVRLVKSACRLGYHGLACIVAVAWDTQFSPVDVRTLAPGTAPRAAAASYLTARRMVGLRRGGQRSAPYRRALSAL